MSLATRAGASVRVRITAVASLFVLLVTAVGAVVVVVMIGHSISHSLIVSARLDAAAIDAQLSAGVPPAEAATTGRDDVVVQLVGPEGAVVAADRRSLLTAPLREAPGTSGTVAVPGLRDTFTVVAVRGGPESGVALIVVGRSTEQRDETRAETAGILAVAVPLLALALAAIVWVSVGRALRPVEVMRQEADEITAAEVHTRLAVPPGADEIPRLAATLNAMLDRIDAGQQRQRRFVSDASHELRTPLAVIRQLAEVALAHPERFATTALAGDVLAESVRLEELVTALLVLARAETVPGTAEVDLDDVVLAEVARVRGTGVAWDVSRVAAARVRGDEVLLGQVVANLLTNARRHAASRVTIALAAAGGEAVLVIEDDGAGVPADQRDLVFERFVRLDEARARDAGGAGLGLAIVRAVVEGHGGAVTVGDGEVAGARFTVRLPATD